MVVLSIAVSTLVLGVVFNSYAILSREMTNSYLKANPRAISFTIDQFGQNLMKEIQQHPEVDKVDARRVISGQIQNNDGDWLPMILFVLRDFNDIKLDVLEPEKSIWPPKAGQILIERQALSVLGGAINQQVNLSTQSGLNGSFQISGTVHDVVQAQAEWENIVYGYITMESLINIGGKGYFNKLNISLKKFDLAYKQILPIAEKLNDWIVQSGRKVSHHSVAKPGKHTHANVTDGMFMIQKVFAILCCILSGLLVYNLISSVLSRQLRQIGVMKAMGAQSNQIRKIYYINVLILGVLGMLISMPLAYFIAKIYAKALALMMNFDIHDYSVPLWVMFVQVGIGLCIPLITASVPIYRASQLSIRETFISYGLQQSNYLKSPIENYLQKLKSLTLTTQLALRNLLRNKGRFVLTTAVLTFSGAMFMASFNVTDSMKLTVKNEGLANKWDLSLKLDRAILVATMQNMLSNFTEIKSIEHYNLSVAKVVNDISHSLPSINIMALQSGTDLIQRPMINGRWLSQQVDEIVVSQKIITQFPHLKIGAKLKIKQHGILYEFKIVGIAQVIGISTVFINNHAAIMKKENFNGMANGYFIVTKNHDQTYLNNLKNKIRKSAIKHDLTINNLSTSRDGLMVLVDHFKIIFSLMMLLTVIIIFIASNGIILTMTTNTLERTREFGILKAIGASNQQLYKMIVTEGLFMGFIAWIVASLLMLPISYGIVYLLGILLLQTPLILSLNPVAFIASLPLMLLISAISSFLPAYRVTKLSVKNALIYE